MSDPAAPDKPPPPTLVPMTVKAARRLLVARGKGTQKIPAGHTLATSFGDTVVTGGPSVFDPTSFAIFVFFLRRKKKAPARDVAQDTSRAVLAIGRAALELGYARAAVRLPKDMVPKTLKAARWISVHDDEVGRWWGVVAPERNTEFRIVPLTHADANAWVKRTHSHLDPSKGSMFSIGIVDRHEALHCVAQVGVVRARMLMKSGKVAEVVRVASDRTKMVASMALGAATRALTLLGYTRVVSYTMLGESGLSYRASGWHPTNVSDGGDWGRPSRERAKAQQGHRKVRWEVGDAAVVLTKAENERLLASIEDAVGKVVFRHREIPAS